MKNKGFDNSEKKVFKDTHIIRIITTNTKTRRLGYIKLLGILLKKKERISQSIISKELENYSEEYKSELTKYKNSKGLITKTKSGSSASPYIQLASKLSFLNLSGGIYSPSKSFLVFIKCHNHWSEGNLFEIERLEKLFLFEKIFNEDFFINRLILESIYLDDISSYQSLRDVFYEYLLDKIDILIDKLNMRELIRNNLKIKNRVKQWEKPEVYLEHVLMPRLNWLLDLSLIEIDKNLNLKTLKEGKKLLDNIKAWDFEVGYPVANCSDILENRLLRIYSNVYSTDSINFTLNSNNENKIIELVEKSFEHFKTFAPNRVTLSQTVNFVKYNIFLGEHMILEFEEIKNIIKSKLSDIYLYRYLPNQKEGYLQKK